MGGGTTSSSLTDAPDGMAGGLPLAFFFSGALDAVRFTDN